MQMNHLTIPLVNGWCVFRCECLSAHFLCDKMKMNRSISASLPVPYSCLLLYCEQHPSVSHHMCCDPHLPSDLPALQPRGWYNQGRCRADACPGFLSLSRLRPCDSLWIMTYGLAARCSRPISPLGPDLFGLSRPNWPLSPPPHLLQHRPGSCCHAELDVLRREDVFFLRKAEERGQP